MRPDLVTIIVFISIIIVMGFVVPYIHNNNCAMPDLHQYDNNTCPVMCDGCYDRNIPICQIPACDHLDCINWYTLCVYKWR